MYLSEFHEELPDEENKFDFNDIDKNDISDNDKNYIQYNFGDLDKSPYEIVPVYFLKVLRYCIEDLLVKDPFAVKLIYPKYLASIFCNISISIGFAI